MVSLNQRNLRLHLVLVVLLCDYFVQSAPPLNSLLPTIKTLDYELTPSANGYHLRLKTTESERDEVVELKNPDTPEQELSVMGNLRQIFLREGYELVTIYVADGNGFRSQYHLERMGTSRPAQPTRPHATIPPLQPLSGDTLKLSTG